uniref:Uncharacterized protein n=1 Tax=Anguilla anguilla TaxID=7936 RepID=A0A0E9RHU3_ANGAN
MVGFCCLVDSCIIANEIFPGIAGLVCVCSC